MPRFQSRLTLNNPRFRSLRTVVPHVIVGALGLEPGDSLTWDLTPGRLQVTVSKASEARSQIKVEH